MKSSKGERWLNTIAVVGFAGILLATISGQAVKNCDVAVWLSMLCNAVMATAAVGAYLTARKWLPQLTTQEGYKEAIKLVNEQYIQVGRGNQLGQAASDAIEAFRALNENNQEEIHTATDAINVLKVTLDAADYLPQEIREAQFRLATYGLTASRDYEPYLTAMNGALDDSLSAARELQTFLSDNFKLRRQALSQPKGNREPNYTDILLRVNHSQTDKDAEEKYRNFTCKLKEIEDLHDKIFHDKPSVGELFTVRK